MKNRFEGQTVFVTGAARGQGRSHAVSFAREGASVAVSDICEELPSVHYGLSSGTDLEETAALCESEGAEVIHDRVDVRDYEQVEAFARRTEEKFGKIDVVVANAGIFTHGTLTELTTDQWDETMDINLRGAWHTVKATVPGMAERKYGRVVIIASSAALIGYPNVGHYTASKWGVLGMTKSLAMEQALNGVTANAVCPTGVHTPMLENEPLYELMSPDNPTLQGALEVMSAMNPQGEPWLEPEDVSRLVLFLGAEESGHITGAEMKIDMGMTAV